MTLEPRTQLQATLNVQVSLNHAAKPGHIAFKRDGSILRVYRLGRLALTPSWVRELAADVITEAS